MGETIEYLVKTSKNTLPSSISMCIYIYNMYIHVYIYIPGSIRYSCCLNHHCSQLRRIECAAKTILWASRAGQTIESSQLLVGHSGLYHLIIFDL